MNHDFQSSYNIIRVIMVVELVSFCLSDFAGIFIIKCLLSALLHPTLYLECILKLVRRKKIDQKINFDKVKGKRNNHLIIISK